MQDDIRCAICGDPIDNTDAEGVTEQEYGVYTCCSTCDLEYEDRQESEN